MHPGVSIAAVALHHRVNANLLRRWVAEHQVLDSAGEARALMTVPQAEFIPLQISEPTPTPAIPDIQIEVRRGAATISIRWPGSAAAWSCKHCDNRTLHRDKPSDEARCPRNVLAACWDRACSCEIMETETRPSRVSEFAVSDKIYVVTRSVRSPRTKRRPIDAQHKTVLGILGKTSSLSYVAVFVDGVVACERVSLQDSLEALQVSLRLFA